MTVLPVAEAVNVVIVEVPPRFSVALAPCVNPPLPMSAVSTVKVPLLVSVTPVTVTLGIVNVPVSVWVLMSKVCTPLPPVKPGVLVIPPQNVTAEFPELFQVAPPLTVTKPVKIFVPVAEEMVNPPLAPPPTLVVPDTVKAFATVKVRPSPMLRLPLIVAVPD